MVDSTPEPETWREMLRAFGLRWLSCAAGVVISDQLVHLLAGHFEWSFFAVRQSFATSLILAVVLGFFLALAPAKQVSNMLVSRTTYYVTIDGKRQKKKAVLTPKPRPAKPIRRSPPTVQRL